MKKAFSVLLLLITALIVLAPASQAQNGWTMAFTEPTPQWNGTFYGQASQCLGPFVISTFLDGVQTPVQQTIEFPVTTSTNDPYGGSLYKKAGCAADEEIPGVAITCEHGGCQSSSAPFYWKSTYSTSRGPATLAGSSAYGFAQLPISLAGPVTQILNLQSSETVNSGACSPITGVYFEDAQGNISPINYSTDGTQGTLYLILNPEQIGGSGISYWSNSTCTQSASYLGTSGVGVELPQGTVMYTWYWKGTNPPLTTFTMSMITFVNGVGSFISTNETMKVNP